MSRKLLCRLEGVPVWQADDGTVEFTADAAIDADGANGQNGQRPAYNVTNTGSDYLANGGMKIKDGKVVGAEFWFRDIVILGKDGQPRVFPGGVIASKTAYRWKGKALDDPAAYVDSETVPYIVVSPVIRQMAQGVVLGSMAYAYNTATKLGVRCVVADIGPRSKIGELSIAAAREIGIPASPRNGGTSKNIVRYSFWPDSKAIVSGVQYDLMPA